MRGVDVAILAVKAEGALETATDLAEALGSTPLLCVASELRFSKSGVRPATEAQSLAERVAERVSAPVVTAEERVLVGRLGGGLVSGRAIDAGPLASARALEGMTAVIVNVNRRYRAHAGVHLTGLP